MYKSETRPICHFAASLSNPQSNWKMCFTVFDCGLSAAVQKVTSLLSYSFYLFCVSLNLPRCPLILSRAPLLYRALSKIQKSAILEVELHAF